MFALQAAGKQRDSTDPDFRDSQNRSLPARNFTLNSGVAFGEMALQQNMTRASYCCAETDVELIVVPKDAYVRCGACVWKRRLIAQVRYTRLIKKFRDEETAARVDFLSSHVYLFDAWARDRVNRIALHMQPKRFTPAQKCLLQGQEPEGLLFLFRGSIKVYRSPVTYMSKAESSLRQRMNVGGTCFLQLIFLGQIRFNRLPLGPFLTAVPDGECLQSDGVTLPPLHKLRTQVRFLPNHCLLEKNAISSEATSQAEKSLWAASKLREKKSESGSLMNVSFRAFFARFTASR